MPIEETNEKTAKRNVATPLVDRMGNPLVLPRWYPGTLEEFAKEVAKLQPHHCSFPSGQCQSTHGGRCCTKAKTRAGVCTDHLSSLLPILHAENMSPDMVERMVRAVQDPQLCEMSINAAYQDMMLARQARKCQDGAISVRLAKTLEELVDRAQSQYKDITDGPKELQKLKLMADAATTDAERTKYEKDRQRLGAKIGESMDKLGKTLATIQKVAGVVKRDEENWQKLSSANLNSVEVKKTIASVDIQKRDIVSREDANRCFMDLMRAMEEALDGELGREKSGRIKEAIYNACWASRAMLN